MPYLCGNSFSKVDQSLTEQQKTALANMRSDDPSAPKGPFLYSSLIKDLKIENTDFLFGISK
jgi:hypothetical protein